MQLIKFFNHRKKMIKNTILEKNQDQDKEKEDNPIYENKINESKQKNTILQKDLEIAHKQLKNNESVIQFHQELLQIRTNLIDAMLEKEKSTSKQINDLQNEIISKEKSYEVLTIKINYFLLLICALKKLLELQKWGHMTQEVDVRRFILLFYVNQFSYIFL